MLIEQHLESVKLRFKWRRLISAAVKDARAELLAKKERGAGHAIQTPREIPLLKISAALKACVYCRGAAERRYTYRSLKSGLPLLKPCLANTKKNRRL